MVQLKRSTLPTKRRRRHRPSSGNPYGTSSSYASSASKHKPLTSLEWTVLLSSSITICSYLLSIFFDVPFVVLPALSAYSTYGNGNGNGIDSNFKPQIRRIHGHAVAHGTGRRVAELSDRYNAIANDVVQVLDCEKGVEDYYGSGGGYGGYGDGGAANGGQFDDVLAQDEREYFGNGNDNNNGGANYNGPDASVVGARAAAAANLDDDGGRVPDIINRDRDEMAKKYQLRRRLQLIDDDGNMMAAEGGENNIVRDSGDFGFNPNLLDDYADGGNSGDWGEGWNNDYNNNNDWNNSGMDYGIRPKVNGRHLLCLAAGAETIHEEAKKPNAFQCDVLGTKRELLLDLWESARGQQIPEDIIVQSLDHAYEHTQTLLDHEVHLWSPWDDEGLKYTLNEINVGKEWNRGGLRGLESALGPHKLFVDVGSNLGLTAMAISLTYPGTAVIAIEPAAPSWILQELNLRCNDLHPQPHISSVLGGVGSKNNGMARMMWRPTSTTSTRSWTPKSEHKSDDIELTVHMRTMRAVIAEGMPDDLPYSTPISVMNLDCEGCEYDVVPSFTEADFDNIDIVLGEIHWGYIPSEKLPSSDRAEKTHRRLCRHEPFARNAIECCAFADMEVDTLVDTASTVKELAGSLCDKFDTWAEEHDLYNIPDDVGWFELSSELDY